MMMQEILIPQGALNAKRDINTLAGCLTTDTYTTGMCVTGFV